MHITGLWPGRREQERDDLARLARTRSVDHDWEQPEEHPCRGKGLMHQHRVLAILKTPVVPVTQTPFD